MLRSSRRYADARLGVEDVAAKTVVFLRTKCRVEFSRYAANNRIAIRLIDVESGEPFTTATANLPDEDCEPNQTHIKDYSENSGILDVLSAAGIVKDTGVRHWSGFCEFSLVEVL